MTILSPATLNIAGKISFEVAFIVENHEKRCG